MRFVTACPGISESAFVMHSTGEYRYSLSAVTTKPFHAANGFTTISAWAFRVPAKAIRISNLPYRIVVRNLEH